MTRPDLPSLSPSHDSATASRPARSDAPPFWLPLVAGLPIVLSLAVMALPAIGHANAMRFRAFYLGLFVLWTVPLTGLQRWLWRRGTRWWTLVASVFAATYAMAAANNGLGVLLGRAMETAPARAFDWRTFDWSGLFAGLDACWLSLLAFAAVHAAVAHAFELRAERERVARAVVAQRDAELRALRYQLQPHFLFNTLNAVSSLVAVARNAEAQTMIARLADFLRVTLEGREEHEVALAEELSVAEGYLDIEHARLGERLFVQWRIGPDVLGALVPTLLLQPLIENAIRHGIAQRTAPGTLRIDVAREGERLCVRVSNDVADETHAPPSIVDNGEVTTERGGARIGLRNLAGRLQALYGRDHALAAAREDGVYRVEIDLPFRSVDMPSSVPRGASR